MPRSGGRTASTTRGGLVILDGDDTLWRTQELYDRAKAEFAALVRARREIAEDPVAVLDRIDAAAARTHGFTIDRFVESMLEGYRLLVAGALPSTPIPQADELQIRRMAEPLTVSPSLYPDTVEALNKLQAHFALILATKGEAAVQRQKIDALGLRRYFEGVFILERKTEREYWNILTEYRAKPEQCWAVGNSVRSDINPALRIGMRAVWIRRPTWLYEEAALETGDVTTVETLTDAVTAIVVRTSHQVRIPS